MFELKTSIQAWRHRLMADAAIGDPDADELEDHLRAEWERLTKLGLSPQEAFAVAAHRVGDPSALALEFGKVHRDRVWMRRIQWMLAGYLGVTIARVVISTLAGIGAATAAVGRLSTVEIAIVYVAMCVALIIGLVGCTWALITNDAQGLSERLQLVGTAVRRHPWSSAAAIGTLALAMLLVYGAAWVTMARFMSPQEIGDIAKYAHYFSRMAAVAVPIAAALALLWIRRHRDRLTHYIVV